MRRLGMAALILALLGVVAGAADARRKRASKTRKAARAAAAKVEPRVDPLTPDGLPNVQSAAVVVLDAKTGAEVWGKGGDDVRAIASTGKIFVAMLVRDQGLDLDGVTTITKTDQQYARGGSRTRLPVGHRFKNGDLLRAMLLASDNRAVTALGRAVGLEPDDMVEKLNDLAKKLGCKHTKFVDPVGLRGNESTPREMALALREALEDDVLAEIMTTRSATIRSVAKRPEVITYNNTNLPLQTGRFPVHGGKTGFNKPAGYCFIVAAEVGGRDLLMSFLGADGKLTRFADFTRGAEWYEAGGKGAALKPTKVKAKDDGKKKPRIAERASGHASL